LSASQKYLHPKYFYDALGSDLFDQITDQPEYYLTRVEQTLLDKHATDILGVIEPNHIVEFGSGMSRKTRTLLSAWETSTGRKTYWPLDVDETTLRKVVEELSEEFLTIKTHGIVADYTAGLDHLPVHEGTTLALFLGSTLGNFERGSARAFIAELSGLLETGDYFLLGVDLHKDPAILDAAYNDERGLTAAFNLNVLRVINQRLKANFDLDEFSHRAHYNQELRQIEMFLDSRCDQQVEIESLDMTVEFKAGESIFTEISRKFTPDEIELLFDQAELVSVRQYLDVRLPYALALGRRQ